MADKKYLTEIERAGEVYCVKDKEAQEKVDAVIERLNSGEFLTNDALGGINLIDYVKRSELSDYAKTIDLLETKSLATAANTSVTNLSGSIDTISTKVDAVKANVENKLGSITELSTKYDTLSDRVNSLAGNGGSGFVTETELNSKLINYATKTDLNNLNYVTESQLNSALEGLGGSGGSGDGINAAQVRAIINENCQLRNTLDILDTGKYFIKNATNVPAGMYNTGYLTVMNSESSTLQKYEDGKLMALRSIEYVSSIQEKVLYVNGVATTPNANGIVTLSAGRKYKLSGYINGAIKIEASAADILDSSELERTEVILDGLYIENDPAVSGVYYGLGYVSDVKGMNITLVENKYNYIKVLQSRDATHDEIDAAKNILNFSFVAGLYSITNMSIFGTGSLAVKTNTIHHAIKGGNLMLSGDTTIYVSSIHDGVHVTGKNGSTFSNGTLYVAKAKDGIGLGDSQKLKVLGGKYYINNCFQDGIDASLDSLVIGLDVQMNFNNISGRDATDKVTFVGVGEGVTVTTSKAIFSGKKMTLREYFGEFDPYAIGVSMRIINEQDVASGLPYPVGTEVWYIPSASKDFPVSIKGYVDKPIVLPSVSATITLNGAYINYAGEGPAVYYAYTGKKLGIKLFQNSTDKGTTTATVNFVIQSNPTASDTYNNDAIRSAKNVAIQSGGHVFISSKTGYGIYCNSILITGDGNRYVMNCGKDGINTDEFHYGADQDKNAGTTNALVYATGSSWKDIQTRTRLEVEGIYAGQEKRGTIIISKCDNVKGTIICDSANSVSELNGIQAVDDSWEVNKDFSHAVLQYLGTTVLFTNEHMFYAKNMNNNLESSKCRGYTTSDTNIAYDFETSVTVYKDWSVFMSSANAYNKTEVDNLLASMQTLITNLTTKVSILEAKINNGATGSDEPVVTSDNSLILDDAEVDSDGNMDLQDTFVSDDGSLNL